MEMMYMTEIIILTTILLLTVSAAPTRKEKKKNAIVPTAGDLPLLSKKRFQGDIIGHISKAILNLAAILDEYRWSDATIPYVMDSSLDKHKELIEKAMKQFEDSTCVKFKPRKRERNYIYMFAGDGCYSYVGRIGGKQELSLGPGCEYLGTIVHELNHAVGFFHEHTRPDRDNYVTIHLDNVEQGQEEQFEKLEQWETRLFNEFDYYSIMLYGGQSFSKDRKLHTMVPKEKGVKLKEVHLKPGLDESDIYRINELYDCPLL